VVNEQRNYKIVKANDLVRKARYDLNLLELKILSFIFSKVRPTDTKTQEYIFSIKDFCQVCGIDYINGQNYINVKNALKQLRNKSFWMNTESGQEVLIGWLQYVVISKKDGNITVKLDENMHKYIIGVANKFTQYELLCTLPMASRYSVRIYEILKSYAYAKRHIFDVENLKEQVSATNYKRFPDFRRKVIEKAVMEINLYSDIEVSWEPIHKGRKVEKLLFIIKKRDTLERWYAGQMALETIEKNLPNEYYN